MLQKVGNALVEGWIATVRPEIRLSHRVSIEVDYQYLNRADTLIRPL
jgi:hypothetical protein